MAARTGDRLVVTALEVNLRKGGTTHPFSALRSLVPGRYEPTGLRLHVDGSTRAYRSTDNVVGEDPWERSPQSVIDAVRHAGLQFDPDTGTGSCCTCSAAWLSTAGSGSPRSALRSESAEDLYAAAEAAV